MKNPNIIFIVADDMGYGDFSAFNYGASHTPVLDELIRAGVCLTQHYSASAVCAPARAGLPPAVHLYGRSVGAIMLNWWRDVWLLRRALHGCI